MGVMSLLLSMMLLLLLQLLKLELLPLQLLKLLINILILLRQITRVHPWHGSWHHRLHARHSKSHGHTKGHGGHRGRHELLLGILEFRGTMTAHAKTKTRIIPQEQLVIITSHLSNDNITKKVRVMPELKVPS